MPFLSCKFRDLYCRHVWILFSHQISYFMSKHKITAFWPFYLSEWSFLFMYSDFLHWFGRGCDYFLSCLLLRRLLLNLGWLWCLLHLLAGLLHLHNLLLHLLHHSEKLTHIYLASWLHTWHPWNSWHHRHLHPWHTWHSWLEALIFVIHSNLLFKCVNVHRVLSSSRGPVALVLPFNQGGINFSESPRLKERRV